MYAHNCIHAFIKWKGKHCAGSHTFAVQNLLIILEMSISYLQAGQDQN